MVKVSFVCPVFNKFKYLPKVLKSINNQVGYFEKEIIFINDGSSDDSLKYLRNETRNSKNVKILSQKNKGPASATQRGISSASGDYIKLVGGDDIMSPKCTKILLETITKTNSVAVFSNFQLLPNYENINFKNTKTKIVKILDNPLEDTIRSCFSGTTPNLYCAKTVKKAGGCDTRLFIEDFSLVLRLSKYGRFVFIDNITSVGPANDKLRIMIGKKQQLIHDYNAALYYFLIDNNDLNKKCRVLACKKSLGRSEKWLRRIKKKGIITRLNLLRFWYYLRRSQELFFLKESCKIFYEKGEKNEIRYRINYSP